MNALRKSALIMLLGISLPFSALAELPQIDDARVVQPPPGATVAAAYFTVNNSGSEPLEITDVSGQIAKNIELHLSFVENDVARMEQQSSIVVDAGQSLEFKHGSFHVMLMGLNEDLVAGDAFELVLETSAGDLSVSVPVISLEDAMAGDGMKHGTGESMDHIKPADHGTDK